MRRVLAVLAVATTAALGWAATAMATVSAIDVDCTHAVAHWFNLPSAQTIRTRVVIDGFEVADLEQQGGPGLFDATASWAPLGPGLHTISVATWRDGGAGHVTVTVDCTPVVVAPPTVAPPVVVPPAQPAAPRPHGHKRHAKPRHHKRHHRPMESKRVRERTTSHKVPSTAGFMAAVRAPSVGQCRRWARGADGDNEIAEAKARNPATVYTGRVIWAAYTLTGHGVRTISFSLPRRDGLLDVFSVNCSRQGGRPVDTLA